MEKRFYFILLFVFCNAGFLMAQPGWNWPDDKKTAEEKQVLYSDYMRSKNYEASVPHLKWLLDNAPSLNASIYINGAKIYTALEEKESDAARKKVLRDSVLLMYDLRIKYFPDEEPDVVNRKSYVAYKYLKDDRARYQELYDLFTRTYELNNPKDLLPNNLVAYMDVIRRYKKTGGDISDELILEKYEMVSQVIDEKKKIGKNVAFLEKSQENVDKLLAATITVDCNFIQENLGPKLKEDPENTKLAKNILKLTFAGECWDVPIGLEAAQNVHGKEPEYGLAKFIGNKCKQNGDYDCATKYYEQAISLTDENIKKADIYIQLASINVKRGQKSAARSNALKAVANDPSKREAYKLIGDLYFGSYEDCRKGENKVHDRAVFIAAYEMYKKAGNNSAMANAKSQFPSQEELFLYNMEVGQSYTVGCWVNETITLQKRD